MKFQDWIGKNAGRPYTDILNELLEFEDQQEFSKWCLNNQIQTHTADWAMLAFYVLDSRLKALEKKKEKDK